MTVHARPLLVGLVIVTAAVLAPGISASDDSALPCVGYEFVPGQGPSCPAEGGWRVLLRDGTSLLTHGPDPIPFHADAGTDIVLREPFCVSDTSTEYHNRLIYAYASDTPNNFETKKEEIRDLVRTANGHLFEESDALGMKMMYRFRCSGGVVDIVSEELPTASGSASFSTIASDLRDLGYTSIKVKTWVWYDGDVGNGAAGQGSIYNDDRLIADNKNNGAPDTESSFAVTYGGMWWRTMMHESGHNLGAVQHGAPDASGGYHCNDGQDIMCYNDGGSTSNYNGTVCSGEERFDCDKDSYFHPFPTSGSYLATHWNLGSELNRFIQRLDNVLPAASFTHACDGWTCSFDGSASNDPDGTVASYAWDIDGITSSGVTTSHTFAAAGTYLARLTVTDDDGGQGDATASVVIPEDLTPPVTTAFLEGTAGQPGWYRSSVDVTLEATDSASGVVSTQYRVNDGAWQTYSGGFTVSGEGNHVVEYSSTDLAGNVEPARRTTFGIDETRPDLANVAPDRGVWVNGVRSAALTLPSGYAVIHDNRVLGSTFPVESLITDALSGSYRMMVYVGAAGSPASLQCLAGPHPGDDTFVCDWPRSTSEHGLMTMRIEAFDFAGNKAEMIIRIVG